MMVLKDDSLNLGNMAFLRFRVRFVGSTTGIFDIDFYEIKVLMYV